MAVALFFTFNFFVILVGGILITLTVRHHWKLYRQKKSEAVK